MTGEIGPPAPAVRLAKVSAVTNTQATEPGRDEAAKSIATDIATRHGDEFEATKKHKAAETWTCNFATRVGVAFVVEAVLRGMHPGP